jgi:hypothetical protein
MWFMNRNYSEISGWVLIVMAFVLLLALHELDLLAVLLPVSLLVTYGIARIQSRKTGLTDNLKKG